MPTATKSTLLVFLFCVLNVLQNLNAEIENDAVAFSSHTSSIEISPQSSNGTSRSYPTVLKDDDATPKLLQKVPALNKIVTGQNFQGFIVTTTSLKCVSLRKVTPGDKRMVKTQQIPPEIEVENSQRNCCRCCCCGFDLYCNFVKDDWQAPRDNLPSAIAMFEQKMCAARENITFSGADVVENAILPPT